MRLLYSLINFLILAVILFLAGKKLLLRMLNAHREEIDRGLKAAEEGRNAAENLRAQAESAQAEDAALYREAERQNAAALQQTVGAINEQTQVLLAENRAARGTAAAALRRDMLFRAEKNLLDRVAVSAGRMMQEEPYVSSMRAMEPMIVDLLLDRAVITPGDQAYLMMHGQLYVNVFSAFELDPALIEKIRLHMDALLDGKMSFRVTVDSALIGGIRLRIGDTVYDGTVSNYLSNVLPTVALPELTDSDGMDTLAVRIADGIASLHTRIDEYQFGRVLSVSDGICWLDGLSDVMYGELVEFQSGEVGMILDVQTDRIGCAVFGGYENLEEFDQVRRLGKMAGVPVGDALLGRVVDPLGNPIDGKGRIEAQGYRPIESPAPEILERQKVSQPLETGIKAIDALVPIGKGQRELIIGDRQTGKTALAVDAILNQKGKHVLCIYVAIGQKTTTVAGIRDKLERSGALDYTVIVCADAYQSAPVQYIAPYAGTAIGEYFMRSGRDVLIVYDDLSKHAVAYREISLLLHRPPGREAYPGDIFYLHSRLLERSAKLSDAAGGGSMTALPIIETQAGDISTFIPTNAISITDGQIFLEADLFHEGQRPAVNVGLSVSRVGGSAQTPLMRQVSGQLRLTLAQYRELQAFSQFGSDVDKATRAALDRGDRMTAVLKQSQYAPLSVGQQGLILYAVGAGCADAVAVADMQKYEAALFSAFQSAWPELMDRLESGEKMSDEFRALVTERIREFSEAFHGDSE